MAAAKSSAAEASPSDQTTVKLSRPLATHEGEVSKLDLREPSAALVLKHGLPWKTIISTNRDEEGQRIEVEFVPSKMVVYLEEMSGLDRQTLSDVSARDMNSLFTAVLLMLQPAGN